MEAKKVISNAGPMPARSRPRARFRPLPRRESSAGGRATLAILALAAFLAARPAWAVWPDVGRAICAAPADQFRPQIVSDGAAGAIIVWQDARSAKVSLFARRVLGSGEPHPGWPVDGRALLADSSALGSTGQHNPVVVPDRAGGAIVAWRETRNAASGSDIFAQHILASGVLDPAWPANGRPVCTAAGDQDSPAIAPDGVGGAIVAWMDARPDAKGVDVFVHHVLATGFVDPSWTANGTAVSTSPGAQAFPRMVSDDAGGAIVTWLDFRPSTGGVDLYAQRVRSSGTVDPAWPVDGRPLSLAAGTQDGPAIVSDGQHGAIIAWTDSRGGVSDIFAQRVLGSGAIATGWPVDGRAICTAADEQADPDITSDSAGGAVITWRDARGGLFHNPFVQHVLASGAIDPAWPDQGRALTTSTAEQISGSIVGDGKGGAIVVWDEDFFVYAHHVEASGVLDSTFPANGRLLRHLLTFQLDPEIVAAGPATAIVAWSDLDRGDSDIYANLVTTSGTVGVDPGTPGPGIAFARPAPNPARGSLTLRFSLPREARVRLVVHDATGRRVRELASGGLPAGEHTVGWDLLDERGRAVGAGLYFIRLEADGRTLVQRVATLE